MAWRSISFEGVKRGVLLLIVVMGCADDPSTIASGARLELIWNTFADGSRQRDVIEVFDAERDEPCVPHRWTDGNTYCTPGGRQVANLATVYASAACDSAALRAVDGGSLTYAPTVVDGVFAALHRAQPLALVAFWVRDAGGACAGPFSGGGQRFYQRGAEVAAAELAPVETKAIDAGGRVGLRTLVSDDGLSLPTGMRDNSRGFDCIVRTTANGVATCLPPRQGALRYADAACREPVVGQHESWSDVAPYMFAGPVCEPLGFMVSTETTVPGYERIGGVCMATAAPIGHRWFQAAPIDLARIERRRVAEPGRRLEAIELVAGDVTLSDVSRFDTRTGGECQLASSAAEPGVRRCLPQGPGFESTYFADAACTRPLPLANVYRKAPMAKCGAELPPFAVAADRPGSYYRIMGSQATPVFRRDETGSCTASPYDGLAGAPLLFQLGELVPSTEFVAAVTDH